MRAVAFLPLSNTAGHRDRSGAFLPGAVSWSRALEAHGWEVDVCDIDDARTDQQMRASQAEHLTALPVDAVAWFCHGFSARIELGWHLRQADTLAAAIAPSPRPVRVGLYACSTADRDHGFADGLRVALGRRGCSGAVLGHTVAGHAFRCSHSVSLPIGADGRVWWVGPTDPEWRAWRRAILNDATLWMRLPWLTRADVLAELAGGPRLGPGPDGSLVPW